MFGWFSGKKSRAKSKSSKASSPVGRTKTARAKAKRKSSGRYKNWEAKRAETFERDGHRCQKCGTTTRLQAHHKCYRPERLVTLCRACHNKAHGFE